MTRASYTVDFKLSVVEWVKNGSKSLREASKQFGVDRKCIRQWVRERAVLGSARIRHGPQTRKLHSGRGPLSEDLDRLVLNFLLEQRRLGVMVGDSELKGRAIHMAQILDIDDFKASSSWLKGWKTRNGISENSSLEKNEDIINCHPVGSALMSHVNKEDIVLLNQKQASGCHSNTSDEHQPQSIAMTTGHVTSHVITPDHTYCKKPSFITSHAHPTSTSSYVQLLHVPMSGHLLESPDSLLLSNPSSSSSSYCSVHSMYVPSSDPVLTSTQVDHFCEYEQDEIFTCGIEDTRAIPSILLSSSSLASLSPPKRSSLDNRPLLWPSLGCTTTSPVSFPEFHDLTDPLTGLLANRRCQPVFPAAPEILLMSNNTEVFNAES